MTTLSATRNVLKGLTTEDAKEVKKAINYAKKHLSHIVRYKREPYNEHGILVASVLRELTADLSILRTAILHDLLIHPDGIELLKESPLSQDEQDLVTQMFALRKLQIDSKNTDLDFFIQSFTDEPRLLILRMAHRLNDVRILSVIPRTQRQSIAEETLHMYTSIAGRLGLHAWRSEMEDACFAVVQPRTFNKIKRYYEQSAVLDKVCLDQTTRFLRRKFKEAGIEAKVEGRVKGIYSTYRKMILKNRSFAELTDRLAIRILTKEVDDCYRALGIVHMHMHPIPGKLKDYIGSPKENGYRSIHSVVYPLPNITEQPLEIQIRTDDMHDECEYGMASHGLYKEVAYSLKKQPSRVNLMRNLHILSREAKTPMQFAKALRTYFRGDQLLIFDPNNNLYYIPSPATALDFAINVLGERAKKIDGLRINGRTHNLDTLLHDGDTVEIHCGRKHTVEHDWIHACKRSSSKRMIRAWCT